MNRILAERQQRITKNEGRIFELSLSLQEDYIYHTLKKQVENLKKEKLVLQQQMKQHEEHYIFLQNNETDVQLANQLQIKMEQISYVVERYMLSSYMAEIEQKDLNFVIKFLKVFNMFYQYKKMVNYEELHEHTSLMQEVMPFLKIYKAIQKDMESLNNKPLQNKYFYICEAYEFARIKLLEEVNIIEDTYQNEISFRSEYLNLQKKLKEKIDAKSQKIDKLELLLEEASIKYHIIENEIQELQQENEVYYSQITNLEEILKEKKDFAKKPKAKIIKIA